MPDDERPDDPKVVSIGPRAEELALQIKRANAYFGDGSLGREADIAPRSFLYGKHYLRSAISATFGDGGVGKSSLHVAEAVAMTSGQALLGIAPPHRLRVFLWNAEEPRDEIRRRVFACCRSHRIDPLELDDYLFIASGLEAPFKIDDATQRGMLKLYLGDRQIDVALLDPLVRLHSADENDNVAMDKVAHLLAMFAAELKIAIDIAHHTRKLPPGTNARSTSHDARGASSLKDAFRSTRVLNQMSAEEAPALGVKADERKAYVRIEAGDKTNYSPGGGESWFHISPIVLANGDDVGAIERWAPKGVLADVSMTQCEAIWRQVGEAKWRANPRSEQWVGKLVASVLELDLERDRKKINLIVRTWIKSNVLCERERKDDKRRPRMFVEQGTENPLLQS